MLTGKKNRMNALNGASKLVHIQREMPGWIVVILKKKAKCVGPGISQKYMRKKQWEYDSGYFYGGEGERNRQRCGKVKMSWLLVGYLWVSTLL